MFWNGRTSSARHRPQAAGAQQRSHARTNTDKVCEWLVTKFVAAALGFKRPGAGGTAYHRQYRSMCMRLSGSLSNVAAYARGSCYDGISKSQLLQSPRQSLFSPFAGQIRRKICISTQSLGKVLLSRSCSSRASLARLPSSTTDTSPLSFLIFLQHPVSQRTETRRSSLLTELANMVGSNGELCQKMNEERTALRLSPHHLSW